MTPRPLISAFLIVVGAAAGAAAQDHSAPPAGETHANAIDGEKLFATSCGWCHQDGGRAPGRGPKLSGSERTDEFMLNRIKTGKEGAMPAFGKAFSEAQLKAIVAYIRGLKDAGH